METRCKIRIVKEIAEIYPEYTPKFGEVYDARCVQNTYKGRSLPAICVVDILGKKIMVRRGEYEIVGA